MDFEYHLLKKNVIKFHSLDEIPQFLVAQNQPRFNDYTPSIKIFMYLFLAHLTRNGIIVCGFLLKVSHCCYYEKVSFYLVCDAPHKQSNKSWSQLQHVVEFVSLILPSLLFLTRVSRHRHNNNAIFCTLLLWLLQCCSLCIKCNYHLVVSVCQPCRYKNVQKSLSRG